MTTERLLAAFRDDDNFQYMFAGTGVSGAGSGSRANAASSGGSAVNPFRPSLVVGIGIARQHRRV